MKVFIVAALVAVACAAPQYPKPSYSGYKPDYKPDYKPSYKNDHPPMPYDFAWAVKDDYTYNDYNHQETSDGNGYVKGSYQTLLPDGRVQTVTYTADDYTGYVADVQYSGQANYDYKPAYKPSYSVPAYKAPAYPAPAYKAPAYPSPAYKSYSPKY
ncbi:cuticle protein 7-like isoform X2 [Artemia franciscana]|uniref:cuticle protein 7-like isoform X1 n=1 Tax=Artemia franciscana TaxID=6661 RepID=UPI0032D9BB31